MLTTAEIPNFTLLSTIKVKESLSKGLREQIDSHEVSRKYLDPMKKH